MASYLTAGFRGVSLRRPARGAKLSVADRVGKVDDAGYPAVSAIEEVERKHRWLTGTAIAAATGMCGDSSSSSRLLRHAK